MGRQDNPPDYEMKLSALTLGTPGVCRSAIPLVLSLRPTASRREQKKDMGKCILEAHLPCILEDSSIRFNTSICVRRNRRGKQGTAVHSAGSYFHPCKSRGHQEAPLCSWRVTHRSCSGFAVIPPVLQSTCGFIVRINACLPLGLHEVRKMFHAQYFCLSFKYLILIHSFYPRPSNMKALDSPSSLTMFS